MKVRKATSSDAPEVAAIMAPIVRETTISFKPVPPDISFFENAIRTSPAYLVAEEMGVLQGFATFSQFRAGEGYARTMELTIMVGEGARGKGVGQALMIALENEARAQKVGSLWAGVSTENQGSIDFHIRLGFEIVSVLPKVGYKFGRWLDLTLMRKWLAPVGDAPITSD